jgi:hypothetical protein
VDQNGRNDGYGDKSMQRLHWLVRQEVDRAFKEELRTAVNEVSAEIKPTIAKTFTAAVAETTKGSSGPYFAAYDDAASDGRDVARGILWQATQTDPAGNVIGEFGSRTGLITAPVAIAGEYLCSDLTGLDANGVADLGKINDGGTAYTDANAIIKIGV